MQESGTKHKTMWNIGVLNETKGLLQQLSPWKVVYIKTRVSVFDMMMKKLTWVWGWYGAEYVSSNQCHQQCVLKCTPDHDKAA